MSEKALKDLFDFPLLEAIFTRRARRFGLGMEVPHGPLAFKSRHAALPLSPLEQALLVAAGTGVTGWNFGVPYTPRRPTEHAHYTVRFTGRTAPTAAGIGTPVLFFTDDDGVYLTNTRDVTPSRTRELEDLEDDAERLIARCRTHTVRLREGRLDLPRTPPHVQDHNVWVANAPGSTLFLPVGDVSEELLGALAILLSSGCLIVDDRAGRPAGDVAQFVRTGLLDESKAFPLSFLEQLVHGWVCMELAFMAHNIVLTLGAMGLGGWFYAGVHPLSVLGAFADEGIDGLGFRFVHDERWAVPNPVGLDGRYEALCPPYHRDMGAAVHVFVERKFGPSGAYAPDDTGPWRRSADVKRSVSRYSDALVDAMIATARYIHETYGKFPAAVPTIVLAGVVQAQHIDTEYYDMHFQPGAYLDTHARHLKRWHGEVRRPAARPRRSRTA